MSDDRVIAIRADEKVGRGSCTSVDECWGEKELVEAMDCEGITSPEAAVKWAHQLEGLFLEQGLNQRWGEDDDPQLAEWKRWQKGDE